MSLLGSNWATVRQVLHEQEASGQFQLWLPDRLGHRIFAVKQDGAVERIELADQTVHPAPEMSRLYRRAQGEPWFQEATFYFTEQGQALVVFPPSTSYPQPVSPVRVGGQEYALGTVGVLLRQGHEDPEIFPLRREGIPLARVVEVEGELQMLYTNMAHGMIHSEALEDGVIRLRITDDQGKVLAGMDVAYQSLAEGMNRPNQDEWMVLSAWDAEHDRVWWWMELPSQSSTRSAPTWRRDIPEHFKLGVWDYHRNEVYKVELAVPDAVDSNVTFAPADGTDNR